MAYTPMLTLQESQTLRRIAWALGMPMTHTMSEIFVWLGTALDCEVICARCRDRSLCSECVFSNRSETEKEAA